MVTFPKKLTISSNVPPSLDSLGDNIAGYTGSILSVVTLPKKLTISSSVHPSFDSLGDNIAMNNLGIKLGRDCLDIAGY